MKKANLTLHLAAMLPLVYGIAVQAEPAQVLFSNQALQVINAQGVERTVKQGDFINPGERVITGQGVLGQIKLPDGTLVSTRPESELRLDKIEAGAGKNVLALVQGNVRVINVDLPNRPKPLPVEVVTPISTLQLTAGDGESFHVKPGTGKTVETGTYNRLQLGAAVIRNTSGELPLKPLESGFVQRPEASPTEISSLPTTLVRTTSLTISPTISPVTMTALTPTTLSGIESPTKTTSVLTSSTLSTASISPLLTTTIAPTTTLVKTTTSITSPTLVTAPIQPIAIAPTTTTLAPTTTIVTQPVVLPQSLTTTTLLRNTLLRR